MFFPEGSTIPDQDLFTGHSTQEGKNAIFWVRHNLQMFNITLDGFLQIGQSLISEFVWPPPNGLERPEPSALDPFDFDSHTGFADNHTARIFEMPNSLLSSRHDLLALEPSDLDIFDF